jgi:catechol 2,3-dioxygenase-like lactoylglutathione lyase family enzyme
MQPAAEVIGIDHIYLSIASLERSEAFYDRVLGETLGFQKNRFVLAGDEHIQYYNRQFGIVLRPARGSRSHESYAPGLHHLCLRVNDQADVERVAKALTAAGIEVSAPRLYTEYAPDYFAVFLSDPDGLRLEVTNFRAERRERMEHWSTV